MAALAASRTRDSETDISAESRERLIFTLVKTWNPYQIVRVFSGEGNENIDDRSNMAGMIEF
jgi:hypothetical protein